MRFIAYAVLLLSAAVLVNAAVGRNEDEESSGQRYRLIKVSPKAEGRTLSQLLSLKGGCPSGTTVTTYAPSPTTSTETSTNTVTPSATPSSEDDSTARGYEIDDEEEGADDLNVDIDDNAFGLDLHADDDDDANYEGSSLSRRGNNRPSQALTLQEYELRRQSEENKQLRQRIQSLRRQNTNNRRRAQRARQQQRQRHQNQRRRANRRNRNSRRRNNSRIRNARRRQRGNRRRN